MGLLRDIFGPSKDEIWGQIAKDIGGQYEGGGFRGLGVLRYRSGQWEISLDNYTTGGRYPTAYTRMRAPFVNRDGLYFVVYQEGILTPVRKFLGMQDIEIGDPYFDRNFVIRANDAEKVRLLLSDAKLRELIQAQPSSISFQIRDDEGWFGEYFPDGVDELYFRCRGVLKEESLLRSLFEIFTTTLERLVQIDSAYENDPKVRL